MVQVIGILWMSVACIRTSIAWSLNQTGGPRSVDIGETVEAGRPTFRWLGSNVLWPSTWRTRRPPKNPCHLADRIFTGHDSL